MFKQLERTCLRTVCKFNDLAKRAAIRLVYYTGKSRERVHPKHLLEIRKNYWFLDHLKPGDTVIDIGCGTGFKTIAAGKICHSGFGVDQCEDLLFIGKREASRQNQLHVHFLRADMESSLCFKKDSFDAVMLFDVLEHVHRRNELLREIHYILKPTGILLLSVPNRETDWKKHLQRAGLPFYSDLDHKIEYTRDEIAEELSSAGFIPTGPVMTEVYDTPWAGLIDLLGGLSLSLYRRCSEWKMLYAEQHPEQSTGFRFVCRKSTP
ncbi:MAG TPA: methyltransferase domain-containing protein [Elusimicrobiota bacterium]|nr:methyltransferase domain-containing protein [Elusimicrobiota bacterium]